MDERKDPAHSIYFCYGYSSGVGGCYFSVLILRGGVPIGDQTVWPIGPEENPSPHIEMRIDVRDSKIQFWKKVGSNWNPWNLVGEKEFAFRPSYVGICSSQGQTNDQLQPIGADTIPVLFDFVHVDELTE